MGILWAHTGTTYSTRMSPKNLRFYMEVLILGDIL